MKIILYKNNSENNKIGKNLTLIREINGTLREQTSIMSPNFEVVGNDVLNSNYCYIPNFKRFYFITDIESVKNDLWNIKMKVDVLESFKNEIGNNTATLSRQEQLYNLYLKDDKLQFTSDTFTLYKEFPNNPFNESQGDFLLLTNG